MPKLKKKKSESEKSSNRGYQRSKSDIKKKNSKRINQKEQLSPGSTPAFPTPLRASSPVPPPAPTPASPKSADLTTHALSLIPANASVTALPPPVLPAVVLDPWKMGNGIVMLSYPGPRDKYTGHVEGLIPKPHGTGQCIFESGDAYIGQWVNGAVEGNGTMIWADGKKYIGHLVDNWPEGKGVLYGSDGRMRYDGDWVQGKRHGVGINIGINGRKYVGDWRADTMHGRGVDLLENGDKTEGDWVNNVLNGKAVISYADGRKYEGDVVDCLGHGQGTWTYQDGRKYVGEWKNGRQNGKGILYRAAPNASAVIYSGDWVNGKMQGKGFGRFHGNNADYDFDGEYMDNHPEGKGVLYLFIRTFSHGDAETYSGEFTMAPTVLMTTDGKYTFPRVPLLDCPSFCDGDIL